MLCQCRFSCDKRPTVVGDPDNEWGHARVPWSRKWQSFPMFLPGGFHGRRGLAGYSPRSLRELDTTAWQHTHMHVWGTGYLRNRSPFPRCYCEPKTSVKKNVLLLKIVEMITKLPSSCSLLWWHMNKFEIWHDSHRDRVHFRHLRDGVTFQYIFIQLVINNEV